MLIIIKQRRSTPKRGRNAEGKLIIKVFNSMIQYMCTWILCSVVRLIGVLPPMTAHHLLSISNQLHCLKDCILLHHSPACLLFARILGPYFHLCDARRQHQSSDLTIRMSTKSTHNTHGIGTIATVIPPRTLHACPTPRLLKNAVLKSGNPAPRHARKKSFPAKTDAT
jgi:hypothetical protein